MKILIIALTAILAFSSFVGSGEYTSYNKITVQENLLYIHADGFLIGINTLNPGVEFYSNNNTVPVFSVSYLNLSAYNGDRSNVPYEADFSEAAWHSTNSTRESEDSTRTMVTMSTTLDMKSNTEMVENWGKLTFTFLIITKGDEAQLGISLKIEGMKPLTGVSDLCLAQRIDGDTRPLLNENRISVSGINYRWKSTADIKTGCESIKREVISYYSNGMLYLEYPYDQNMVEISHNSGEIDFGTTPVIRDCFSEIIGYGAGVLLGSLAIGLPYIVHKKNKKSPFDMDSPLYRK